MILQAFYVWFDGILERIQFWIINFGFFNGTVVSEAPEEGHDWGFGED